MGIISDIIGIGTSIIGGNKAKKAANQGFDWAKGSPLATNYLANGAQANSTIADLLGIGGDPAAANAAFDRFQDSTGFDFMMDQGSRAITGNQASRGLLQSGSTLKALNNYGQKTGAAYFQNYLANLGALSQSGQQAGNAIANAGVQSAPGVAQAQQDKWQGIGGSAGNLFGNIGGLFGI